MTGGYTGKILRVNLTTKSISTISTSQYENWYGGNGMGAAIFWDLVVAPGNWDMMDGFDPRNVITVMTSPLSGTLAPHVAGRTEIQGINVQTYPTGWYSRSGFGGRFAGRLKSAGWDGIVVEGKSSDQVWINIIDDKVTFESAKGVWGLDAWEAQEEIWRRVTGDGRIGDWLASGTASSTQLPAVMTIGAAGENMTRLGAIIHDAGNGAGQGGYGSIMGAKNLKAISVAGSGSVAIADPKALIDSRLWYVAEKPGTRTYDYSGWPDNRRSGCESCPTPCRNRYRTAFQNDSQCVETLYSPSHTTQGIAKNAALIQRYGINCFDGCMGSDYPGTGVAAMNVSYLLNLYKLGVLGPGKKIESSPLPMDLFGTPEFDEILYRATSNKQGIGKDLAEGAARAAIKWGRYEEDSADGRLGLPQWGVKWHHSLPTAEWAYGSLFGDRDTNEHRYGRMYGNAFDKLSAEQIVKMITDQMAPFAGDPFMLDYTFAEPQASVTGIYSDHWAKFVSWDRAYNRFWIQTLGYCDWGPWPAFVNPNATKKDFKGTSPEAETRFFNAVTGKNLTWAAGMDMGRKVWNMERAIWILQGRHRDQEKFAKFFFKPGCADNTKTLPVFENNKWVIKSRDDFKNVALIESKVEEFKTKYYTLEGWDTASGWPKRKTLEDYGMKNVADVLAGKGKLGNG